VLDCATSTSCHKKEPEARIGALREIGLIADHDDLPDEALHEIASETAAIALVPDADVHPIKGARISCGKGGLMVDTKRSRSAVSS
jgi:hypothetical protein